MNVEIVVERDGQPPRVQALPADRPVSVGRNPECTICVPDDNISRQHVVLYPSDDSLRVEDTSRNGTLAGARLLRGDAIEVPYGTPIFIGMHTLHVRRSAATPARPEPPAGVPFVPRLVHTPPAVRLAAAPSGEAPVTSSPAAPVAAPAAPAAAPAAREPAALRREIHRRLLQHLDLATTDAVRLDDPSFRPRVLTALRRIARSLAAELPAGFDFDRLVGEMADEALGLGPLEHLLADASVSEIMVTDADTIYVERHGKLERSEARFTDDDRVRAVIERIVTPLGRRIDESSPLVDARLADGSRVNAVIRPLAVKGSCITIRKFSRVPFTLENLIDFGALDRRMADFLVRSVIAKKNIVISGGTGSGKTTLLNVLSAAIPAGERIVTIEDSAELKLGQPHVVALETRPANMEGKGDYTIRELVKNALRMRPDRIVVGECRGGEALDMLQAMNTGHDGSLTTTHANSPREALARLETLALMAGIELPARAIREQIAASIELVVQQSRLSDGSRKVTAVTEVCGLDRNGEFETRTIYHFVRSGTGPAGEVLGSFSATGYLPTFLDEFIVRGLIRQGETYL